MSATVIESVKAVFTRRENEKATTYGQLVASLAGDEKIDPESVASILQAAGKSPHDLQADVERVKARREAAATIKTDEPKAAELRRQSGELGERARADLEAARVSHDGAMREANELGSKAEVLERQVRDAKRLLAKLTSPELLDRRQAVQNELSTVNAAIGSINGRLSGLRRTVHDIDQQLESHRGAYGFSGTTYRVPPPVDLKPLRDKVAAAKAEIPALEAELSELESRRDELKSELAKIELEILAT